MVAPCSARAHQHDFAQFEVSYPPDSTAWPGRIEAWFGGRLLSFTDGSCGLFNFGTPTAHWYSGRMAITDAVLGGSGAQATRRNIGELDQ